MKWIESNFRQILLWVFFFGIFLTMCIIAPGFIDFDNIMNVLVTISFVSVPAIGLAIVMLSGSFDLSFVGVIGVSAVATVIMVNNGISLTVALIVTLIISVLIELINAFFIIKMEIHPWLATIATMLATLGLEKALSRGYYMSVQSKFFDIIRFGYFFHIPVIVWILLVTLLLFTILINRTPFGLHLYAVGGNYEAARKAGIKVNALRFSAFMLMGVLCWLSSILYVSQLSGYPPEAAYTNQLEVILAVFLGMAISKNNIKNVPGAFFGAAFVALMANGLGLAGISSYWIKLIEGCLVILVIIGNSIGRGEIVNLE